MQDGSIIFLHHSTGESVWNGGRRKLSARIARKLNSYLGLRLPVGGLVPQLLAEHNRKSGRRHQIVEQAFPKAKPYGWRNYPFDYYNIWVKNAGTEPFREEPTLELLTRNYNVVVFKHCFPVSNIGPDKTPDVNDDYRSLANYKLQYLAMREKFHQFPKTRFIVWTGAAQVEPRTTPDEAKRAREFFDWVRQEWATQASNIFLWDFYGLQTEGQLYFQPQYAVSPENSHPNESFSRSVARSLLQRVVDVVESNGTSTDIAGQ